MLRINLNPHSAYRGRLLAVKLLVVLVNIASLRDPFSLVGVARADDHGLDGHQRRRGGIPREALRRRGIPDVSDTLGFAERHIKLGGLVVRL